jgi:hypothetical protein
LLLTVALTLVSIFLEVWALGRFSSEPFYLAASVAAAVVMAGAQGLVYGIRVANRRGEVVE